MKRKKVDMGEFLPYINGRYVNPYAPKQKVTIIKGDKNINQKYKSKVTNASYDLHGFMED